MGSESVYYSVVVPLYNEEDNVQELQQQIHEALKQTQKPYEIVFVDDGSIDETVRRVVPEPNVRVLEFEKNAGQSAAMYVGMHAAYGKVIILMDGDLQNDPADVNRMLDILENGYDLVCGFRAQRKDTWSKRMTSKVANAVRSRFTRDGVRDTGCSLKVLRKECVQALVPFYGMHRFIPALIKGAGFRITETPVNHRARVAGVSKYGFGNRALKATVDMLAVRWILSRQLKYKVKNSSPE